MRIIESFYSKKTLNDNIKGSYTEGLADPFIYRYDGDYYLFFTAKTGLKAFKTHDFKTFLPVNNGVNEEGYVAQHESLVEAYAPEMIHFNGNFYLITSIGGCGHYILKSSSIIGPYEFLTPNIHESIDGSFFIDEDEEIYLTRASETGIAINKLNSNFESFKTLEDGSIDSFTFNEARTFGWTEGPYILKRYGKYYLTYTGTHFLSSAYRVNYCVGKDLKGPDSLKFKNRIIMSLRDDYYGLGHSATFLGPNLDSYFISYHDMNPTGVRTVNISRLLFGDELMVVNDVDNIDLANIEMPIFETRNFRTLSKLDDIYFYLNSSLLDANTYSFEVNFYSNDAKIYFGYKNDKNKKYVGFAGNLIQIHEVIDGNDSIIYEKEFKYEYKKESLKTIRVQVKNKVVALYFNNIELIYNLKTSSLNNGHIGFKKEIELSSFFVSKYSFGNSDNEEIKRPDKILASNFDSCSVTSAKNISKDEVRVRIGDTLRYYFYVKEEGYYNLDMNFTKVNLANFSVSFNIDNSLQFIKKINLRSKSHNVHVSEVVLSKGVHFIEVSAIDEFKFSTMQFTKIVENCRDFKNPAEPQYFGKNSQIVENCRDFEEKNLLDEQELTHIGEPIFTDGGIYFDNDRNFSYLDKTLVDFDVSVKVKIRGNQDDDYNFGALVVLNNLYGKQNEFEHNNSLDGIMFGLNKNHIFIKSVDFDYNKTLFDIKNTYSGFLTFRVVKTNGKIKFYLNEKLIFEDDDYKYPLRGKIGLYNVHTSVYFKDLIIKE